MSKNIKEIKDIASKLGREYGVERIYLFGSYARGDNNKKSDIDFRIDKGEIKSIFDLGGLHADLEEALDSKIDLITTESLDVEFLKRIREEEVLLYESKH